MKRLLKLFGNWIVIGLWFLFIVWISYFVIKARSTTNPGLTEQNPVWGLYVSNGDTLTAAKRNKLVDNSYKPYVSLTNSAGVSVANNSSVRFNFDTENSDTDDLHTSASPTKITIKKSGKYLISAYFTIGSYASNGIRTIYIYKNHSQALCASEASNSTNTTAISTSWITSLVAWDYLEVSSRNAAWTSLTFTPLDFSVIYLWE